LSAQQFFGGQQLIHRAGAEAFQVESDELESQCFKEGGEFAGHFGGQGAGKFVASNFNADDFAMMAYAELAEAKGAQRFFAALDDAQRLGGDLASIFEARGKTGRGGLVPYPQIGAPREFPDISFIEAGFEQRGENVMLARGLLSGAKVACIVGVDAVGDGVESAGLAISFEDGEQFVLAVKAAHGIVADVGGILKFLRFHDLDGDGSLAGKVECVVEVSARQAGGIGDHGEHFSAEGLVGHPGQESGVHATGVGDDQASASGEELAQAFGFLIEGGGGVHNPPILLEGSAPCMRGLIPGHHVRDRPESIALRCDNQAAFRIW
jgi:hypothetical protein